MLDGLLANAWIAVAAPLLLALSIAVLGTRTPTLMPWLAMLGPLVVFVTGIAALVQGGHESTYAGRYLTPPVAEGSVRWLLGTTEGIRLGYTIDGLTALMLVVVGVVALTVMMFSIGYMAGDAGIVRYYVLLSLFTASMTLLVMADGLVGLFLGWELVGACSYLLIGFWFHKPTAAAAAVKAFLTTRVGDVGMLLGLAVLWKSTGALSYPDVFAAVDTMTPQALSVVALLLFVGAAGKSAQFPLHIWLPDAMEGPTPVSALIHAATMVAAGVFLVVRTWPVFEASPHVLTVILVIGAFTALTSASVALVQTDIKKVLAYSTISQLGFMFAALGAGAWVAAMFHLITHAAFKALLFLGSGSVIHGADTQDMREMGGLFAHMPVTGVTWIIGSIALAGIPPLAGFWSKDEVVHAVMSRSVVAGASLLLASLLTAFYIARATRLTFFGSYRGTHHPHESGSLMLTPLIALATGAVLLGFTGHWIAEALGSHGESLDLLTAGLSIAVALVGSVTGWVTYRNGVVSELDMESRLGKAWPLLERAYGFDTFVSAVVVRPLTRTSDWLYGLVDRRVVDGAAEGLGALTRRVGALMAALQYGDTQWYVSLLAAGFVVLAVLASWGVR